MSQLQREVDVRETNVEPAEMREVLVALAEETSNKMVKKFGKLSKKLRLQMLPKMPLITKSRILSQLLIPMNRLMRL